MKPQQSLTAGVLHLISARLVYLYGISILIHDSIIDRLKYLSSVVADYFPKFFNFITYSNTWFRIYSSNVKYYIKIVYMFISALCHLVILSSNFCS